jgi:multiple sugar transport system substrate-binding protein
MKRTATSLFALSVLLSLSGALAQNITFWHTYSTGSGEEKTFLEQIIPRFEEENPGITVEAVAFPYDEFRQKLLTSFAGGEVPDLVRMDIIWVPEFADMGALEPLDDYEGFAELSEVVFPGPLATNFWDGAYYGLPLDTNTQVMIYNADQVMTPPATFDDFKTFVEANSNAAEERWAYAIAAPQAWYLLPWIWSNGGAITDEAITTATGYLNSPATVEAVQMLVDLYNDGQLAPTLGGSGIGTWEGLGAGNYAATQDGPWTYPSISAQYPDMNFQHAPFPAGPAGSISIVGGEDVVMFADSADKDAAWTFAQFLLSPWAQETMAATGQMPVLTSATEAPYITEHPYYGVYLDQLQTAQPRTPHPAWSRMDEILMTAFQQIILQDADTQAALDQAAAQIDGLLQ